MKGSIVTRTIIFVLFCAATVLAAACGGREGETKEVVVTQVAKGTVVAKAQPTVEADESVGQERLTSGPVADIAPQASQRLIIKDAALDLEVSDTDRAIDGVTQVTGDMQGYIISQRVWVERDAKFAAITLAVPVQEFENTLRRLRGLAVRVLNESASGEDVTDQYVDLQSRLRNLEATRDRIRTFLDQAATVNEALNVNRELSEIEDQIEQVKGRLNYLRDRAAFSTITVTLTPLLPTPTPTPTPTPEAWRPGETVQQAGSVLVTILKGLTELAIWAIIVLGPFAVAGAVGLWLLARWVRRLRRRAESRATPNEKMDQEETQ